MEKRRSRYDSIGKEKKKELRIDLKGYSEPRKASRKGPPAECPARRRGRARTKRQRKYFKLFYVGKA